LSSNLWTCASRIPQAGNCQISKSGLRLRFQPLDEEAFFLFAIRLNDTPSIAARLRTAASPRFSCSPITAAVLPASANVRSRCPSSGVHGGVGRRIVILILLSARARPGGGWLRRKPRTDERHRLERSFHTARRFTPAGFSASKVHEKSNRESSIRQTEINPRRNIPDGRQGPPPCRPSS
jgi:hypothetical protein